jgi:hypothetical protein
MPSADTRPRRSFDAGSVAIGKWSGYSGYLGESACTLEWHSFARTEKLDTTYIFGGVGLTGHGPETQC